MPVYFIGDLRRANIEARFAIKPAPSSHDIGEYQGVAPQNLNYDSVDCCYRPSEAFKPLFSFQSERVLAWLLQGFGDGLDIRQKQVIPCVGPSNLIKLDLGMLGTLTRSMCAKRALRINYLLLSSGAKKREIVPVALANTACVGMRSRLTTSAGNLAASSLPALPMLRGSTVRLPRASCFLRMSSGRG
jgi:hypothetical protein